MAFDEKRFETRGPTFPRRHRGELAIAASLSFPSECRTLCRREPFRAVLARAGLLGDVGAATNEAARDRLPLGVIVAVVEVVDYCNAEMVAPSAVHQRCYSWVSDDCQRPQNPAPHEHDFGDYSPGRTIILTANLRRLARPVPVERIRKGVPTPGGALGLYTLSPACEAAVRAQLVAVPQGAA
jgi:hypothetical protein